MVIQEFLKYLRANPEKHISIRLSDGSLVPAHYHITEVGHVTKRFVDCGGVRRVQETCLLQTWVHDDVEHRLHAGKLADIFDRAGDILPNHDLPIEVEHELEVVAQFPVENIENRPDSLVVHLGTKHTDCLARGICLPNSCEPPQVPVAKSKAVASSCSEGSGCC
jgi:hypothetical protein